MQSTMISTVQKKTTSNSLKKLAKTESINETSSQATMATEKTKLASKMRVAKQLEGKKILKKHTAASKIAKKPSLPLKEISPASNSQRNQKN